MMAPAKIIDYMVVHELCHMHHRNHSDAFWNEVDKVMPDYRERKMWLKKHGAGLDFVGRKRPCFGEGVLHKCNKFKMQRLTCP